MVTALNKPCLPLEIQLHACAHSRMISFVIGNEGYVPSNHPELHLFPAVVVPGKPQ